MHLVKTFLRYIIYAAALSFLGLVLFVVSAALTPTGGKPAGISLALLLTGIILFFGSPIIVFFWVRWRSHKIQKQNHAKKVAAEKCALEQEIGRRRFFERERLIDAVDAHRAALLRNLERAVKFNDYGALVEDRRHEALYEFFASIELDTEAIAIDEAADRVAEQIARQDTEARANGFDPSNLPFDGHAFEHWVASGLQIYGWNATVTQASGDQGIDVVAEKDGKRLGLQCKLYSSKLGNKAVQEAYAGMAYHGVDRVGVISNANFTTSAKDLAASTGVLLLSHHDIPNLFNTAFGGQN